MSTLSTCMLAVALLTVACGSQQNAGEFNREVLMKPHSEAIKEQAPATYTARFETSAGDLLIQVERALAPNGADRFYNLVINGFYDDQRFFRVVPGFVVQWGMHGEPEIAAKWLEAQISDDPVKSSNVRGTVSFAATSAPNSRTTQVFINLGDNTNLDAMDFAPFGRVTQGLEVLATINGEYREQPSQQQIARHGNTYLEQRFPRLDYIKRARIIK